MAESEFTGDPLAPVKSTDAAGKGAAISFTGGLSLDGRWMLQFGPLREGKARPESPQQLADADWPRVDAIVPGNVEIDLARAGVLPDLTVGDRCFATRSFESCDWWYTHTFASPQRQPNDRIELIFEGIDTLATVWLNGRRLGRTANMLIAHRFDVTDCLHADQPNTLVVRIESTILAAQQRIPEPGEYAFSTNFESLAIRKAPHMFGWDILPRLVSAGLWRSVRLETVRPTRWRDVYFATIKTDAGHRTASAMVDWDFVTDRRTVDDCRVRITLRDTDGGIAHREDHLCVSTHGRAIMNVANARLWWPRGSGEAHLYELSVELVTDDGAVLDVHSTRVGLRTVELRRTDLTNANGDGEFCFVVNSQKIFVRGTNWVPLDALHSRDPQHLDESIAMLVDLNCNMVRCWGGNVYEDHAFFDLCDRQGLMVWQDFAMGCAVYPQTDDFAQQIRSEAEAVVRKLRNHPSLALWAGNNENDEAYEWSHTGVDPNTDRISREVLPRAVRRLDPLRPYLPSSPYRPPAFFAQDRSPFEVLPEQHLWGPRDDFKGKFYTTSNAHFASEIGYHGCPNRESLEQMMEPGSVWPWQDNKQWLAKAVQPHPHVTRYHYRIPLMARQIAVLFAKVPETLDDYILASQISQAEALKFFIEHFRRGKWRRTGILWWNLRDGWPVISDAIVDYYNRKKLAYDYVKRSQTDVCVMIGEPDSSGRHSIIGVNDSPRAINGQVRIRDADGQNEIAACAFALDVNAPAKPLATIARPSNPVLWLIDTTLDDGSTLRNHYLAGPRPFDLMQYRGWLQHLK